MLHSRMSRTLAATLLAALPVGPMAAKLHGQCNRTEEQKLTAADGAAGDLLGGTVALSGDVAVLGATGDDAPGVDSGSACVYRFDGTTWSQVQKLTASDGAEGDRFGSVAASGGVIVVGAAGDNDMGAHSGSAYVFRFDGQQWVEEQKLTPSDGAAGDLFGNAVAVDGNVAVVGAFADGGHGSAYVFRFDGIHWVEEQKLEPKDLAPADAFGVAVALSGNVAVIGAFGNDDSGAQAGAAYVFRNDGLLWKREQKLKASDGTLLDNFGISVAIEGAVACIGAFGDDDLGATAGAVYVFRRDETAWVEEQKLTAGDGAANQAFGNSVSVSDDAILVGALGDDDQGAATGAAYLFRHDGTAWMEEQKLLASDQAGGDQLGVSVALDGDTALLGANSDADQGDHSGSAYVFRFRELVLGANDLFLDPGETLTLTTCRGINQELVVLFVVELNGVPTLSHAATGIFDILGRFADSNVCPPGVSGLYLDVQSFGFFSPSRVGTSNRVTVTCN